MKEHNLNAWVQAAKARGWGDFARLGVDALAPLGPLGAQLVWVSQPFLSLFVGKDGLATLAEALETPEGLNALRGQLEARDPQDFTASPLATPPLRTGLDGPGEGPTDQTP